MSPDMEISAPPDAFPDRRLVSEAPTQPPTRGPPPRRENTAPVRNPPKHPPTYGDGRGRHQPPMGGRGFAYRGRGQNRGDRSHMYPREYVGGPPRFGYDGLNRGGPAYHTPVRTQSYGAPTHGEETYDAYNDPHPYLQYGGEDYPRASYDRHCEDPGFSRSQGFHQSKYHTPRNLRSNGVPEGGGAFSAKKRKKAPEV